MRAISRCLSIIAAAVAAFAADAPLFPRPNWFRQHFGSPAASAELRPPARITDHVVDGKLELSLRAYLELAIENNTDIALAKLQVLIPQNAIQRAFSVFDPLLSASFNNTRSTQPTTSSLAGASTLKYLQQPVDFTYSQTMVSGASMNVGFDAQRNSSNNSFSTYNPSLSSSLSMSFDQPLLRNRAGALTRINILMARSNLKLSRLQLRDQLSGLLAAAESAYWDVVEARENVALQNKFLELRLAALDRAQKQVDAGALLPLDVFQPKSDYASAQLATITARQSLAHRENALRTQIGADLDPKLRTLPIVLTEPFAIAPEALPDKEQAIQQALAARPDRLAVSTALDTDDLGIRHATEALRPSVSLTGNYVTQGVGGIFYKRSDPFGSGTTVVTPVPGGLADALGQVFGFGFPVYSFGLRMRLPLRDRAAAADLADAAVRKKQDSLQLRRLEQAIRVQVLNAVDDLEAMQASMKQAEIAREFAEKRFAAEQKKYELGVTQLFFVLDAQTRLNLAENDVLRNAIQYRRGLVNLHLMLGDLLAERGVTVE